MRWYRSVGSIVVVMMAASVAAASAAVGPEASGALLDPSPKPSPCIVVQTDPPCPTDPIYLTGQVVGEYQSADWPKAQTQSAAHANMGITLTVEPLRVAIAGFGSIDGAYTGNCLFSDSGSDPISWDSNDPTLRDSVVSAQVIPGWWCGRSRRSCSRSVLTARAAAVPVGMRSATSRTNRCPSMSQAAWWRSRGSTMHGMVNAKRVRRA
jgi:hypothetical protein